MVKLCTNINGVKPLSFIKIFHHFVLYSTSTQSKSNPQFSKYLVQTLGFSNKQALSTSSKLTHSRQIRGTKNFSFFNFMENSNLVISYLTSIGLQQSHIATAISRCPQLLLSNVDRTLKPKTEIFIELGFSRSDLVDFVQLNPFIYFMGLNTTIVPTIKALIHILGSKDNVIRLMKTKPALRRVSKAWVTNIALLQSYGIPIDSIRKSILISAGSFSRSHGVFKDALIRVEEKFGIPRESPSFLVAVHLVNSVREKTLESKFRVFKSFGWSEVEILALLRSKPVCFVFSEAKIKEKLGFLMNELGYDPKFVASKNGLMTCSLEKRIVPRHKVFSVLKEKGLIKSSYSLYSAVCISESKFLEKFVLPYKEVHQVYANQIGSL